MATMTETPELTLDELLQLDDGVERWSIQGEVWEKPMTYRNRWHSALEAWIVYLLLDWLVKLPLPRGRVLSGEAGFRLRRDPNSTVGIDVAYVSAEVAARNPD